jgi:hypothetical protein
MMYETLILRCNEYIMWCYYIRWNNNTWHAFKLKLRFSCIINHLLKDSRYSINIFTSHIDKKISLTFFLTSLSLYIFTIWKCIAYNRFCRDGIYFDNITVFTVFRLLTDFVCLYNYEFWLSLCKIVRSSVILLLPLSSNYSHQNSNLFSPWYSWKIAELALNYISLITQFWNTNTDSEPISLFSFSLMLCA